jgi:hypothetical protein
VTWHSDLADYIIEHASTPLENGRSIVIGPPEDDDSTDDLCVGLVARPGPIDETYTSISGRPNLTVVVRSEPNKPKEAYDAAVDVWRTTNRLVNETYGETHFVRVQPLAYPERLRKDSKMRTDYTFEVSVMLGYEEESS